MDSLRASISTYAQVELFRDAMGRGGALPAGRIVSGTVIRLLDASVAPLRYEVSILGTTYIIESTESFAPGTVLEFVGMPIDGGGVRLLLKGAAAAGHFIPSSGAVSTPNPEPGTASAGDSGLLAGTEKSAARRAFESIERAVAGALRSAQIAFAPERAAAIAQLIAQNGLETDAAARAAARLFGARLPITASLLRGGTLAERSSRNTDTSQAVARLVSALTAHFPAGSEQVRLAARLQAAGGAQSRSVFDAAVIAGAKLPGVTPRVDTALILGVLEEIVWSIFRDDRALRATQTELARLLASQDSERGAGAESKAAGPPRGTPERSATDPAGLLDPAKMRPGGQYLADLTADVHERALRVFASMERDAIENHPRFVPVRDALRELFLRLESATYAQLLEWSGLAEDARSWCVYSSLPGDPGGTKVRVHGRKNRAAGEAPALAFTLEFDSGVLGQVRVAGRLEGAQQAPGGALALHFAAENPQFRGEMHRELSSLLEALAAAGYVPGATVGALTNKARGGDTHACDEIASPCDPLDIEA